MNIKGTLSLNDNSNCKHLLNCCANLFEDLNSFQRRKFFVALKCERDIEIHTLWMPRDHQNIFNIYANLSVMPGESKQSLDTKRGADFYIFDKPRNLVESRGERNKISFLITKLMSLENSITHKTKSKYKLWFFSLPRYSNAV